MIERHLVTKKRKLPNWAILWTAAAPVSSLSLLTSGAEGGGGEGSCSLGRGREGSKWALMASNRSFSLLSCCWRLETISAWTRVATQDASAQTTNTTRCVVPMGSTISAPVTPAASTGAVATSRTAVASTKRSGLREDFLSNLCGIKAS